MNTEVDLDGQPGAEPATIRPRAHIVTIYGLYAREAGGWLSVGSLIKMMGHLGVEEPAVRSSISRLKRRGLLESGRVDGTAGYGLSERARTVLDEGDRRIFARHRATVSDGWLMAVFSVPETERQKRHTLRSQLSGLGYGTVGPGVWIAPGHLEQETRQVLTRHDLSTYVDLFHADYLGFRDLQQEVATWWDLDALDGAYRDFSTTFDPMLAAWKRRRSRDDPAKAFADYVTAVTAWRRLPYLDPGLPSDLLPRGWAGTRAADLFFGLHERLKRPAHRYLDTLRST